MATGSTTITYVGKKFSVIRWKQPDSTLSKSNIFTAGSWDDEENIISVWSCSDEGEPSLLHELPHKGDVTDIIYLSRDSFASSSSNGTISLYQHERDSSISVACTWLNCHRHLSGSHAACCSLASNGSVIASVGEDAKLLLHKPGTNAPLRTIESGSDCSEYAVAFVRSAEVLTGNMQGQLRLWDTRRPGNSPVSTMTSSDQEMIRRLNCHPSQQHVVAAAGEGGTVTLWDMRDVRQPFTCVAAHSAPEAHFHTGAPDHLFSCGLDGQLVHWNANESNGFKSLKSDNARDGGLLTSWLRPSVSRGDVSTTVILSAAPLSLNSLDVQGDTLIAASDNEAIYVVRNVILY